MKRIFDRLHVWLSANAPDVLERFAPGASEAEIRAAEQEMGVTLPDDVRAAYRIHYGCNASFLYGEDWCSLEAVVSGWRMLKGLIPLTRLPRSTLLIRCGRWLRRSWSLGCRSAL